MKILKEKARYFLLALILATTYANADIAIVVGSQSSISTTESAEIGRLYLGKTKSIGGANATAVNQGGTLGDEFNKTVLNKSSSQVKAYWSKLVFTGKGTPPKELGSDADVISAVASDPNTVGYIDAAAVTDQVKVLLTL